MNFLTPMSLDVFGAIILLGLLGTGMLFYILVKNLIKAIYSLFKAITATSPSVKEEGE